MKVEWSNRSKKSCTMQWFNCFIEIAFHLWVSLKRKKWKKIFFLPELKVSKSNSLRFLWSFPSRNVGMLQSVGWRWTEVSAGPMSLHMMNSGLKDQTSQIAPLFEYFNEENVNFDLWKFHKMIFQDVHFLKQLLLSLCYVAKTFRFLKKYRARYTDSVVYCCILRALNCPVKFENVSYQYNL